MSTSMFDVYIWTFYTYFKATQFCPAAFSFTSAIFDDVRTFLDWW